MQKNSFQELIPRNIGSCSAKRLKYRVIDLTFSKPMRFKILNITKVAPEIFDFLKMALADFEFDTPALRRLLPFRICTSAACQDRAWILRPGSSHLGPALSPYWMEMATVRL